MFTRFANVFFDAADDLGGGGGEPAAGTDTSPDALAAARESFLNNPPEIPEIVDEPEPTAVVDPLDDPDAADLLPPPAGTVPAVPATGGTPADDPYAEFGGREAVEKAVNFNAAMRTESGVRLVVAQSLQALGYKPEQIRAALEGGPSIPLPDAVTPPADDPLAGVVDLDDDDYVSGADLKRIVAKVAETAAEQAAARVRGEIAPVADAFQEQQARQAGEAAHATYVEILGAWPEEPEAQKAWEAAKDRLALAGTPFIDPDDWSPNSVRMAILRAQQEVERQDEANLRAHIARKRAAREASPTNVGGGQPPGGVEEKEPQNLAEARERFFKEQGLPT